MKMEAYEKEHLKRVRKYLAECAVLLKSNGDFPLEAPGRIAAFGSGVRHTIKGGTGSGDVNSRFTVNVETGLEKSGFTLVTKGWLNDYDEILEQSKKDFIADIKAQARKAHMPAVMFGMGAVMPEPEYELPLDGDADTAVYVLARISGEGNDRTDAEGDIRLTQTEIRDILALKEKYPKFMLVLNTGGVVDLSPVLEVENILYLSQLGADTGLALAQILLGKQNPSGKLASTWAAWEDYPTLGEFGDIDETRYYEGVYVGYRYFDTAGVKPLFPFGYGLSYTSFAVENTGISLDGETVTVTASVENTGAYAGKEVVQVYVSKPEGLLDQPYQVLAGWKKTAALLPGEAESAAVTFPMSSLASYDTAAAAWVLEAGDYIVRAGTSSADTEIAGVIRLADRITVKKVKNLLGMPDFSDWKPEKGEAEALPEDTPVLTLEASSIVTEETDYDLPEPVEPFVETLSDEELMYLVLGSFDPKGGFASIVGNASQSVAGAAGETTNQLLDQGLPALVMADGPAGLRLNREYTVSKKGAVQAVGNTLPASMAEYLPGIANYFMEHFMSHKPKAGETVYEQYCTAIPIGTAIAQSWNTELAELLGDMVGEEMERFGVDLWLAPALNIRRSVRCGRNFEYYSEDPLISGRMAGAITEGVQKHPGRGTTIKHFAANNQETNRLGSNSQVSERAMREIYLKGFEICVRETQPLALMTSYNLLNGTHTSERRDLTMDILRAEWGYEGIVMTDWVINTMMSPKSVHPGAVAPKVVKAGGDLFMPGQKGDFAKLKKAFAAGELSREDMEKCASRVVRMIWKMKEASGI